MENDTEKDTTETSKGGVTIPFPVDGARAERGPDGRFVSGNQAARQHGIYAHHQPADLRASVDELVSGIVADLGGEDELSTLERAYIGRFAEVDLTLRLCVYDIAEHGLFTQNGGVRRVYGEMLAGLDRWDRLAQRLGLKRRQKHIDLAQAFAAQERGGGRG